MGDDGTWGWRYERNEAGQVIRKFPLDMNGRDSVTAKGLARVEIRVDPRGNPLETATFGANGDPVLNAVGIAKVKKTFDDLGNPVEAAYIGTDGYGGDGNAVLAPPPPMPPV